MSDRITEIENRLNAATPGPWKTEPVESGRFAGIESRIYSLRGSHILLSPTDGEAGQAKTIDAEFIAHSPSDVAYLLAELRKRDEALDRVEALAKYLDGLAPGDQHYAKLIRAAVTGDGA